MSDFATLGMDVDSSGLVRGRSELGRLTEAGGRAERGLAGSANKIGAAWKSLARVVGSAVAGLAAAFGARSIIRDSENYELRLRRIQAILKATGGVAGRSSKQLEAQAQSLARASLASVDGIMAAQQTLLTFRNIRGQVFDETIQAALDLSTAMGQDLNSSILQVAKALEDPVRGMTALSRSGTVFTDQQREMVKAMVEAGDTMGAQNFILSELNAQYGGAAEAVPRLSAAQDSLGQSFNNLLIRVNEVTGATEIWASMIESVDGFVRFLSEDADALENGLKSLGVVVAALAATQLPAVVAGLGAMVTAMTTAGGVAGVLTTAMRVLGGAVALAGGPLGLLLGVVGGAAAAMILFRDNTDTVAPIVDEAKRAVDEINGVLATSSEVELPDAARETLNLTNANIMMAKSAYEAASAERDKARAMLDAFTVTGGAAGAMAGAMQPSDRAAAISGFETAQAELARKQATLNDRVAEGQLALSKAADAMAENRKRAIELSITQEDLATKVGGAAGNAGELTDEMKRMQAEMENADMASERWANSMGGHFDGLITGGKDFSGVLMSIARQLESSAWENLFSGNLFGGGGGAGGGGAGLLGLGGFLGFLDKGGSIGSGQFAIAGERGPEIVRGPAHVTSRAETARIMQGSNNGGGGSVRNTYNIDARGAQEGVADQIVAAIRKYDREALPRRVQQISRQPRRIG